jgi:hypothetical protein
MGAALASAPDHTIDLTYQAESFTALLSRLEPSADPDGLFMRGARSKDFCPRDRLAIAREVRALLAQRRGP